jgi:hypothetical protein
VELFAPGGKNCEAPPPRIRLSATPRCRGKLRARSLSKGRAGRHHRLLKSYTICNLPAACKAAISLCIYSHGNARVLQSCWQPIAINPSQAGNAARLNHPSRLVALQSVIAKVLLPPQLHFAQAHCREWLSGQWQQIARRLNIGIGDHLREVPTPQFAPVPKIRCQLQGTQPRLRANAAAEAIRAMCFRS